MGFRWSNGGRVHQPTVGARLNNGRIWTEHEAGAKTADLARKHGVSEATNRGRMKVRWQVRYDSGSAALTHSTKTTAYRTIDLLLYHRRSVEGHIRPAEAGRTPMCLQQMR